jgi:hypothetical protein
LRAEVLTARTQSFETEIKLSKQKHEKTLTDFQASCTFWKTATKALTPTTPPTNDILSVRIDGVAGAAKDAESAISHAMSQPSSGEDVEEINRRVLRELGIKGARIRRVQKCRAVGKHIDFEPAKKNVTVPPGRGGSVQQSPAKEIVPTEEVERQPEMEEEEGSVPPTTEGEQEPPQSEEQEEEEEDNGSVGLDEGGHANEAFEAIEAMDYGNSMDDDLGEFSFDSENPGTMDVGVD